jgi:hypothetical protein
VLASCRLIQYILRQREYHRNPLPRPPVAPSSLTAQEHLNDTSVLADAHEEDTVSSVGSGTEAHLVGDGDHVESPASQKAKNKLVGWGQKISGKAATLRSHGKVTVLPEGNPKKVRLPFAVLQKRRNQRLTVRLHLFLVSTGEVEHETESQPLPPQPE